MPHRVLVIETCVQASATGVCAQLSSEAIVSERVSWDELRGCLSAERNPDAVMVVIHSLCPAVTETFEWLQRLPRRIPSFAILQANCGDDIMKVAARFTDEFVLEPVRPMELRHRLSRVLADPRPDLEDIRRRLLEEPGLTHLVGRSPVFLDAVERLPRFARTEALVLITGETGTGKEVCARALHHVSRRRRGPFVAVDSAAVPDQLFENELFGHVRGAFTDAHRDHKGLVALAEGGTLFLDEVDALSLAAQAKLLRFLQERTFRPLGGDRFERADVRVIAASNRDLDACVSSGRFRADLYFRLNVLRLHLPPLRDRQSDVELLVHAALKDCRAAVDASATSFSPAALRMLREYSWPGNVRELYNVVQRAAVACETDRIGPQHLSLPRAEGPFGASGTGPFRAEKAAAIAAFERRYVETLLRKHDGNVTRAAREANQDRRAFGRFIKKYNINRRTLAS